MRRDGLQGLRKTLLRGGHELVKGHGVEDRKANVKTLTDFTAICGQVVCDGIFDDFQEFLVTLC